MCFMDSHYSYKISWEQFYCAKPKPLKRYYHVLLQPCEERLYDYGREKKTMTSEIVTMETRALIHLIN